VTVKTFKKLEKTYISHKCCSFYLTTVSTSISRCF